MLVHFLFLVATGAGLIVSAAPRCLGANCPRLILSRKVFLHGTFLRAGGNDGGLYFKTGWLGGGPHLPFATHPSTRLGRNLRTGETWDRRDVPRFFGNGIIKKLGQVPHAGGVDDLSLPRPLLTLHHYSSQYPVDSRLVTRTFGLEPVEHLGIHAQRDPPLAWTVPA
jgi:hypothetical protein